MGKGDRKTKRGKFFLGSFGVRRPSKQNRKRKNREQTKEG